MPNEQENTLSALQTAIQMEIDGKKFYTESSRASKNILGKKLFSKLAGEEDIHRKVFESIYKEMSAEKDWPENIIGYNGVKGLQTVFALATDVIVQDAKSVPTELEAVQTAMDMENKTFDFYKKRSGMAAYSGEKELYEAIAVQEKEHHRVLLDYFEFLKNPAAWFVQHEHLSVDGG